MMKELTKNQKIIIGLILIIAIGAALKFGPAELAKAAISKIFDEMQASLPFRQSAIPVRVSSGFGERIDPITGEKSGHSGTDFAIPVGTDVLSILPGVVRFAGSAGSAGMMIEIDHPNKIRTRYMHNSQITVKEGDAVSAGQLIAKSGNTGRSTGPHSHIEIQDTESGKKFDLMFFLIAIFGDQWFR